MLTALNKITPSHRSVKEGNFIHLEKVHSDKPEGYHLSLFSLHSRRRPLM